MSESEVYTAELHIDGLDYEIDIQVESEEVISGDGYETPLTETITRTQCLEVRKFTEGDGEVIPKSEWSAYADLIEKAKEQATQ